MKIRMQIQVPVLGRLVRLGRFDSEIQPLQPAGPLRVTIELVD